MEDTLLVEIIPRDGDPLTEAIVIGIGVAVVVVLLWVIWGRCPHGKQSTDGR